MNEIAEPLAIISDHHWALWAREAADTTRYADVGYPHQSPFYSRPRLGDTYDEPPEIVTDLDMKIAELIGTTVVALARHNPQQARCLRIFFGADRKFAHMRRKERIAAMDLGKGTAYAMVDKGRAWVEGFVIRELESL